MGESFFFLARLRAFGREEGFGWASARDEKKKNKGWMLVVPPIAAPIASTKDADDDASPRRSRSLCERRLAAELSCWTAERERPSVHRLDEESSFELRFRVGRLVVGPTYPFTPPHVHYRQRTASTHVVTDARARAMAILMRPWVAVNAFNMGECVCCTSVSRVHRWTPHCRIVHVLDEMEFVTLYHWWLKRTHHVPLPDDMLWYIVSMITGDA